MKKMFLKICSNCGFIAFTQEDLKKFRKNKSHKDGYESICRECYNRIKREQRKKILIINYQGMSVRIPDLPKPTICRGCGRKKNGEITRLAHHHWTYKYRKKKIRENPKLALENTVVVCYPCHRIADALRELYDVNRWNRIVNLLETMPPELAMEVALSFRELDDMISRWLKDKGID